MMAGLAKKIGLGDIAARFYNQPREFLKQMWLEGGLWEQRLTGRGHLGMRAAAIRLPLITPPEEAFSTPVRFLSGAKFWHQTLFCLVSLQLIAGKRIDAIVFDDSTMSDSAVEHFLTATPWVKFVLANEISERIAWKAACGQFQGRAETKSMQTL